MPTFMRNRHLRMVHRARLLLEWLIKSQSGRVRISKRNLESFELTGCPGMPGGVIIIGAIGFGGNPLCPPGRIPAIGAGIGPIGPPGGGGPGFPGNCGCWFITGVAFSGDRRSRLRSGGEVRNPISKALNFWASHLSTATTSTHRRRNVPRTVRWNS